MERQIYTGDLLFGREQAARGLVHIRNRLLPQTAGCLAMWHLTAGAMHVVNQILRHIEAATTTNRTTQRIIDGSGAGQFLLSGRPLNILTAVAIAYAHIHSDASPHGV